MKTCQRCYTPIDNFRARCTECGGDVFFDEDTEFFTNPKTQQFFRAAKKIVVGLLIVMVVLGIALMEWMIHAGYFDPSVVTK